MFAYIVLFGIVVTLDPLVFLFAGIQHRGIKWSGIVVARRRHKYDTPIFAGGSRIQQWREELQGEQHVAEMIYLTFYCSVKFQLINLFQSHLKLDFKPIVCLA